MTTAAVQSIEQFCGDGTQRQAMSKTEKKKEEATKKKKEEEEEEQKQ